MMCIKNKIELPEEILENISGGAYVKEWLGKNWDKLIYIACALGFTKVAIDEIREISGSANMVLNNINETITNTSKQATETLNNVNIITNKIAHPMDNAKSWICGLFRK